MELFKGWTMKSVLFKPGYYEWLLLVDNELIYVDSDGVSEYLEYSDCKDKREALDCYCDTIIDYIKGDYQNDLEEIKKRTHISSKTKEILDSLSEEDYNTIKNTIYNVYKSYYL